MKEDDPVTKQIKKIMEPHKGILDIFLVFLGRVIGISILIAILSWSIVWGFRGLEALIGLFM